MEPSKELATTLLEALEFDVESIPESDDERADLLVRDDANCYVIETKDKDDIPLTESQEEALQDGEVVHDGQKTTQNNRIAGVFTKARDQMDRTPADEGAFRVIWFQADGIDRQLIWDRAFATFYGKVDVFPIDGSDAPYQPCYYFDYATSYNMPTVDALILCDGRYMQLLLNEFSENLDAFRDTKLYNVFAEKQAIADPEKLEAENEIITFRKDVPRKNDDEILAAILESTGIKYTAVRMVRYAARVLMPDPRENDGE